MTTLLHCYNITTATAAATATSTMTMPRTNITQFPVFLNFPSAAAPVAGLAVGAPQRKHGGRRKDHALPSEGNRR